MFLLERNKFGFGFFFFNLFSNQAIQSEYKILQEQMDNQQQELMANNEKLLIAEKYALE
jgi:hypothetical protein